MNKTRPLDNRYEIEIELGQGFFASVYRARNLRPDHIPKIVALKVFKTNFLDPPERDERFIKEASIIQDITHDHIVRIYDARTTAAGDICYIVMQYIEGQSLQQRLERERLPWQQARFVLDCLTEAIEYLHTRQIVHGDIKPSNIMIDRDGDLAYLLDLGLARVIGYDNLQTRPDIDVNGNPQMPPGTIFYMAPELWKGQPPTPATDLYALA
jgi:serine/threonine protein kinase